MAHTPGPWSVDADDREGMEYNNHICAGNERICFMAHGGRMRVAEFESNARLIAAAPELLEALKFAADIIGHPDDVGSKMIAAVIAKAEGRE